MRLLLCTFLLLLSISASAQQKSDSTTKKYPYVLPIWGQKAIDRGYGNQLQLPFGLNANYVYAGIGMRISEFELFFANRDLSSIINTETLNFKKVFAFSDGVNYRADAWVLPVLNVYGLFSKVRGGTEVVLQPTWYDDNGELLLQLPEFGSQVSFDAIAYGAGATMVYGNPHVFFIGDANYSATRTELLENDVGIVTTSLRVGHRFLLFKNNPDVFLAPYVGTMFRDFVGAKGSRGKIGLDEVFPEADEEFNKRANSKIQENEDKINDPSTPVAERLKLQAQNAALRKIQSGVNESGLFTSEIEYFIFKEMKQQWTFQFGFNFQLSKHWMLRGEYGVSDSQQFIITGVQYRFGL